jgi:signal-transduction protein with cAMP-binding, CBS, and nucleotidyltransferase domain
MKKLTENNFTTLGTEQFVEHTRMMTVRVSEVISGGNPIVSAEGSILDAVAKMSEFGLGAVTVVNGSNQIVGIFTDGDLRRLIQAGGKDGLNAKLSTLSFKTPLSISGDALLYEASDLLKKNSVDNLIVTSANQPIGMLDVQDLVKSGAI